MIVGMCNTFCLDTLLLAHVNDVNIYPIHYNIFSCRFLSSKPAAKAIAKVIESRNQRPWLSWRDVPLATRESWFHLFQIRISCLLLFKILNVYLYIKVYLF